MWHTPAVLVVDGDDSHGAGGVVSPDTGTAGATDDFRIYCEYVGQADYWNREKDETDAVPTIRDVYAINILHEEDQSTKQIPVFFNGKEITVYEDDALSVRLRAAVRSADGGWAIE